MLSGIYPVTSGRIWFDDRDVTALPPEKRNIGLVFQNLRALPAHDGAGKHLFPAGDQKDSEKTAD
jgi:ABC-type sugar transport system ATPase subunit